ncbi:MAG: formylglycine-generating enzyme family protein, partial [Candidatus Rokuibacteriota bacterium]
EPARVFGEVLLPLAGPPPVGRDPANGFGLTDLSGVVHEWCLDWHDDGYYAAAPAHDPRGPAEGTRRVSRGGAWRHQNPWSPVAHRSSLPPHLHYSDYGFRVVRDSSGS